MLIQGRTRFGIAIPQMFPDGRVDMTLVSRHLETAEALGYESAWTQDQMIGVMPALEPFTLMTYAAAVTRRLQLGVSVLVMPFRVPVHVAKVSASLDQMCGGRLIVGVGIGGGQARYPAFGIDAAHRVSRFEESLALLKRLWTESDVDHDGRFWQLEKVNVEPKPLRKPHPPLVFGAQAKPALERAVRLGNGWMGAGSSTIPDFKRALADLRGYLAEAGVDAASFPLSKRVYVAVDGNEKRAKETLMGWFAQYYGNAELALDVAIWGSEQACVDKLGQIYTENLDSILFNPVHDLIEQASILAEDIVPKL